ncbi:hypothetical protein V1511DRAFT_499008 [Dipodascopsis uninucleata]
MSKRANTGSFHPQSKRSRHDDEYNDRETTNELLESDIPGLARKRKNKLRLQGYESDSSEDDFFSSAKAHRAADKGKDGANTNVGANDGDEDMFGSGDDGSNMKTGAGRADDDSDESSDEDDIDGISKKSKKVRFLNIDDIEGQEFTSKETDADELNREVESFAARQQRISVENGKDRDGSKQDVNMMEASDGEDPEALTEDIDPEIGAEGSRINAPKIEAFNMREELEEGQFDANGNFIRREDEDTKEEEKHDLWLDGLSTKEIKAAAQADEARKQRERQAERDRTMDEESRPASMLMKQLLEVLDAAETPLEALQRLGPSKKKKKWQTKKKKNKGSQRQQQEEEEEEAESKELQEKERIRKVIVEKITDAADKLMSRGTQDIYELSREQIARLYSRDTGEEWRPL